MRALYCDYDYDNENDNYDDNDDDIIEIIHHPHLHAAEPDVSLHESGLTERCPRVNQLLSARLTQPTLTRQDTRDEDEERTKS